MKVSDLKKLFEKVSDDAEVYIQTNHIYRCIDGVVASANDVDFEISIKPENKKWNVNELLGSEPGDECFIQNPGSSDLIPVVVLSYSSIWYDIQ